MKIAIENLTKKFGPVFGVNDLSLDIKDGEFVAFLGPSGCGKTTTLLTVAGIYKPTAGTIRFGERIVNTMQPRDRNIGMVFQSYALYPHMTVFENIAYPLKLKGVSRQDQHKHVQQVATTMGIAELLERRPGQLSGGQQQRVALGRALVKEPDVLLFDEPLSNLDARLRLSMRGEIKQLQNRLGITSIYVTHDQVEALTMADRIAVISKGKLQAFDTPEDLYDRPKTLFIAEFIGNPPMNFATVEISGDDGGLTARIGSLTLELPSKYAGKVARGQAVVGIRPEDITLVESDGVVGSVFVVEPLGREDMLDVRIGDQSFLMLADPELHIKAGDNVSLRFNTEELQLFDRQTEKSLLWN